jgi:putative DeoR family transcriptional regulator (stage III sporulation protein D)
MDYSISDRTLEEARHIARTGATVRQTAEIFGVGKSTVHQDMTRRLPRISSDLSQQVAQVLDKNLAERHIRGGQATRQRYKKQGSQLDGQEGVYYN